MTNEALFYKNIGFYTWGVHKSLARLTSRCRRTVSIVSLERGVCSCAELQLFSCDRGWKEACYETSANSTTRSVINFSPPQGKEPNEIYAFLKELLGEYAPCYVIVKNCVTQYKRGDFSTCFELHHGRHKTVTSPEIVDQINELILEDRRISAKSIAE